MISSDGQLVTLGQRERLASPPHPELTRAIYNKANNSRARYIYIHSRVRIAKQDTLYYSAIKSSRGEERFSLFANSDLIIAADSRPTHRALFVGSLWIYEIATPAR